RLFSARYKGRSIEDELKAGNIALALSFAGRKIGTAFAMGVAANLVVYEVYDASKIFLPWIIVSLVVITILKVLSFISERVILLGVDTAHELLEQRNIAVGALRAVIYISMAVLVSEL